MSTPIKIAPKLSNKDKVLLKKLIEVDVFSKDGYAVIDETIKAGLDNHSVSVLTLVRSIIDLMDILLRKDTDADKQKLTKAGTLFDNAQLAWENKMVLNEPLEKVKGHLQHIGMLIMVDFLTEKSTTTYKDLKFTKSLASLGVSKYDLDLLIVALLNNVTIQDKLEDTLLPIIQEVKDVYVAQCDVEVVGLRTLLSLTKSYIIERL
jgi:hypothetical protein